MHFPIPPNQPSDIIYDTTNMPIYDSFIQNQPNATDFGKLSSCTSPSSSCSNLYVDHLQNFNQQHRGSVPYIHKPYTATSRRHTEGSISIPKSRKRKTEVPTTDESKRKEFLERNRQAALKCRQRKKQWLADLQQRVEFLTSDNEQLQSQASYLKEQVLNLKTLLLAHVDCKVAQSNGTTANVIQSVSNLSSVNNFSDNVTATNFQF